MEIRSVIVLSTACHCLDQSWQDGLLEGQWIHEETPVAAVSPLPKDISRLPLICSHLWWSPLRKNLSRLPLMVANAAMLQYSKTPMLHLSIALILMLQGTALPPHLCQRISKDFLWWSPSFIYKYIYIYHVRLLYVYLSQDFYMSIYHMFIYIMSI